MNKPSNDTALLIFTRSAKAEAASKNFLSQKATKANKKIAEFLIKRTIETASASGLPYIIFTEAEQKGSSFGEKLSGAVQSVFEQGFQKLIVIGNDCLQLQPANIQEACILLQTNNTVLAPTRKGGVCLIGITKETFNQTDFENVDWQTVTVYNELLHISSQNKLSVASLQLLDDVSDVTDLKKQIRLLSIGDAFRKYIISLIASLQHFFHDNFSIAYLKQQFSLSGLRAPPLY